MEKTNSLIVEIAVADRIHGHETGERCRGNGEKEPGEAG